MAKKTISVIIPCRNQEKKIGQTIDHIKSEAKKLKNFNIEIVFVNDRSTDNSAEVAKKHLADYKNSQILHTDKNYVGNGKGLAVILGMDRSKGDYRLFMDADNSTKFEEIEKFIPYFDKYDIVLGTRYSKEVVVPSGNWFKSLWLAIVDVVQVIIYGHALRYTAKMKQGRLRELVSRGGNLAFTVLLGQSFTDSRCGFKMYSKEAALKIFPQLRIKTWDFDSEALVLAKKYGFSMVEVPVVWYDDAGASNFKVKDMINAFKAIFAIRWYQITGKYEKSKNKKFNLALIVTFFLSAFLFLVSAYLVFDLTKCGFAREISLYRSKNLEGYFFGKRYCKNLWDLKELELEDVNRLDTKRKIEIFTKNESEKLENELEKHFLGYNKYKVGEGKESFTVYETICSACETNL